MSQTCKSLAECRQTELGIVNDAAKGFFEKKLFIKKLLFQYHLENDWQSRYSFKSVL
jgi:hypothetical protein